MAENLGHEGLAAEFGPGAVAGDADEHLRAGAAEAVAQRDLDEVARGVRIKEVDGLTVVEMPEPDFLPVAVDLPEQPVLRGRQDAVVGPDLLAVERHRDRHPARAGPAGIGRVAGDRARARLAG